LKTKQNRTIIVKNWKRGAGRQLAESGIWFPDPQPDLDNANVGI